MKYRQKQILRNIYSSSTLKFKNNLNSQVGICSTPQTFYYIVL